jgi:hypothetical protein
VHAAGARGTLGNAPPHAFDRTGSCSFLLELQNYRGCCTRRCRLMSSTRCVVLKCKIVKSLFGSEKTTAWQQRVLELDRKNLRWFATASSTVAQNEFNLASISSVAPYASTENPWVPRSLPHLPSHI